MVLRSCIWLLEYGRGVIDGGVRVMDGRERLCGLSGVIGERVNWVGEFIIICKYVYIYLFIYLHIINITSSLRFLWRPSVHGSPQETLYSSAPGKALLAITYD